MEEKEEKMRGEREKGRGESEEGTARRKKTKRELPD